MNRSLLKWVPCLVLFCLFSSAASAQQIRIATVDLSRVFTNYWKFKQANAALEDMKAELAKTDREMIESFQKEKEVYQKLLADANNQAVSAEERENRKKAAEEKLLAVRKQETDILEFEDRAKRRLGEQTLRMRDNLLMEIRAAVNSKAKAGNYNLIFDSAAQSDDKTPVILYAGDLVLECASPPAFAARPSAASARRRLAFLRSKRSRWIGTAVHDAVA
jgi:outer membrane protein